MSEFRKILTAAVGVSEFASDDEIARALAEILRPQAPVSSTESANLHDDPQSDFDKLARLYAKTHNVSLSEAYSRVSAEAPILFHRARAAAELN